MSKLKQDDQDIGNLTHAGYQNKLIERGQMSRMNADVADVKTKFHNWNIHGEAFIFYLDLFITRPFATNPSTMVDDTKKTFLIAPNNFKRL